MGSRCVVLAVSSVMPKDPKGHEDKGTSVLSLSCPRRLDVVLIHHRYPRVSGK